MLMAAIKRGFEDQSGGRSVVRQEALEMRDKLAEARARRWSNCNTSSNDKVDS